MNHITHYSVSSAFTKRSNYLGCRDLSLFRFPSLVVPLRFLNQNHWFSTPFAQPLLKHPQPIANREPGKQRQTYRISQCHPPIPHPQWARPKHPKRPPPPAPTALAPYALNTTPANCATEPPLTTKTPSKPADTYTTCRVSASRASAITRSTRRVS